jgi:hypothetical protein
MTKYLSTEEVIEIHQILINEFAGNSAHKILIIMTYPKEGRFVADYFTLKKCYSFSGKFRI